MTVPEPLQQVDRTFVLRKRRKLSYFAGCDYFRLSSHPKVLAAAHEALDKFGLNVSASRLTTGNHELYGKLEKELIRFFKVPSATLTSNGYFPNIVVAQALKGQFSHVLIDEKAHASLMDAACVFDCPVIKFQHRHPMDLSRLLERLGRVKPVLLTDGMFSSDGSVAPIGDYLKLLPEEALILIDDAHGAGVLGAEGRGTPEYTGISRKQIIQTITLSKAFGAYGGAVLGPESIRKAILSESRAFVGNTPLPLPLANASLASLRLLSSNGRFRERLITNSESLKHQLLDGGLEIPAHPGPIVPIIPGDARSTARLRKRLLAKEVFPSFIKYPGGPENGYFRFVISSEHTPQQLQQLASALLETR